MEKHVSIVGLLHILVSGLHIFLGIVWLLFLAAIKEFLGLPTDAVPEGMERLFALILAFVPTLMILTGIPGLIAGLGLLNRAPWSRILAMIVGAFQLPNMPFGTGLGIYTIVVLLDEDARRSFERGSGA